MAIGVHAIDFQILKIQIFLDLNPIQSNAFFLSGDRIKK